MFLLNFISSKDGPAIVQKQSRDERAQEDYCMYAVYFCRCSVAFLRSFISVNFPQTKQISNIDWSLVSLYCSSLYCECICTVPLSRKLTIECERVASARK